MCILFIHTDPNPKKEGYRLIVASNRDEYYERPAAPAAQIDNTSVIGGKYRGFLNKKWMRTSSFFVNIPQAKEDKKYEIV